MSDDDPKRRDRDRKVADLKQSRAPLSRIAGEMIGMAAWKKKTLAAFLFIAAVGGVLWVTGWVSAEKSPVAATGPDASLAADDEASPGTTTAPPGASFIDGRQSPNSGTSTPDSTTDTPDPEEDEAASERNLPWTAHVGGWMAKLGLSFAGGLVLGIFFRTFLKTMAAITALAAAVLVGLSYFELINIDFTTMQTNYDSFAGWLADQGWRVREMVVGVLPSAFFAGFGFVVGFLRR